VLGWGASTHPGALGKNRLRLSYVTEGLPLYLAEVSVSNSLGFAEVLTQTSPSNFLTAVASKRIWWISIGNTGVRLRRAIESTLGCASVPFPELHPHSAAERVLSTLPG